MIARTLLILTSMTVVALGQVPDEPALTPDTEKLAAEAKMLDEEGKVAYLRGQYLEAVAKWRKTLEIRQELYPEARYPDGHAELAGSLSNLSTALQLAGQADQALVYVLQSAEMYRKLFPAEEYPTGHPDLATCLSNVSLVLSKVGQAEQALKYCKESLQMKRKIYPALADTPYGHADLAISVANLGAQLHGMGRSEQALPVCGESLEMWQNLFPTSKFPNGNPYVATGLNNLGAVLAATGRAEEALSYHQQSLQMRQKLYPEASFPNGHPLLVYNFTNMGVLHKAMGQNDKALEFFQNSLEMSQKLFDDSKYPTGHPQLACSFNNMGFVLQAMDRSEQSLPFFQESLEMNRKLYAASQHPHGHPELANSLNNVGFALQAMGQVEQALPYLRQGLEMRKKLYPAEEYPTGHPNLAFSFANMGSAMLELGRADEALPFVQQSLALSQELYPVETYPDGHPQLATSLNNLAGVLHAVGQLEQALSLCQQSLEMQQGLLRRELVASSEEAAFDKVSSQPLFLDTYLSVTRELAISPDTTYAVLWPSRSMVTRLLEQRQAAARAAGTEAGGKLTELRSLRRRIDQLLQDIRHEKNARDKLLVEYADKHERLERELIAAIPALSHWQELDQLSPDLLAQALPEQTAFIDFVHHTRFQYVNQKQIETPTYSAFVLTKNRSVQRIDFDATATEIDQAVASWRQAIADRLTSPDANWLSEHLWMKLARVIPLDTSTIYIAADGNLARVPWAALPTGRGRVLLEDVAIAQVPHGTFLLDHLTVAQQQLRPESLLTLGAVDYGPGCWPALPGTATEVEALTRIAPETPRQLTASDATAAKLKALLPQVHYAHLATHGEFQADELAAEKERAARAIESRFQGDVTRQVASKNPLGFVGLVMADGEILSGLGIVDLKLDGLHLVTLSACETGLGELTGGEGVQGLQRAFHLAGCPNVIASPWKVNDAATAALMAKFYHELWVNKKSPIVALRAAQLTVYRRPDLITDLAGERGAPKLAAAVKMDAFATDAAPRSSSKRADTKLWAAFVISGAGK